MQLDEIDDKLEAECKAIVLGWYADLKPGKKYVDCLFYPNPIPHTDNSSINFLLILLSEPRVKWAYLKEDHPGLPRLADGTVDILLAQETFARIEGIVGAQRFHLRYIQSLVFDAGETIRINRFDELESFAIVSVYDHLKVKVIIQDERQFSLSKTFLIGKEGRDDINFSERIIPVPNLGVQTMFIRVREKCQIFIRGVLFNLEPRRVPSDPSNKRVDFESFGFRRDL